MHSLVGLLLCLLGRVALARLLKLNSLLLQPFSLRLGSTGSLVLGGHSCRSLLSLSVGSGHSCLAVTPLLRCLVGSVGLMPAGMTCLQCANSRVAVATVLTVPYNAQRLLSNVVYSTSGLDSLGGVNTRNGNQQPCIVQAS